MLSRFRNSQEQGEIIRKLGLGELDIVIGTHRMVQKDVIFKDLGLLIIDEEQRFGVTHKEYLKKVRTEVDVLTMTATPIPRTLYMALTGVRDISTINTPPEERLPVVTHVGPYSEQLVRQAVLRELAGRSSLCTIVCTPSMACAARSSGWCPRCDWRWLMVRWRNATWPNV
jgi:transcription-repair coupling factor (superfamily II helicase)